MKYSWSRSEKPLVESIGLVNKVIDTIDANSSTLKNWLVAFARDHKLRLAVDIDLVNKYTVSQGNVLDVGAIPPTLTGALKKHKYKVIGLDRDAERYKTITQSLSVEILQCDIEIEKLPFGDDKFDTITFNEVFEHLRINPVFTMKEILRVLKPGGRLLLSTPNLTSAYGIINLLFNSRAYSCAKDLFTEYDKVNEFGMMGHMREYTAYEACSFLERIGFSIEKVIYRTEMAREKIFFWFFPPLSPFMTIVAKSN